MRGMPDIRMNGSCAGGTGAFIDEMSSLLNVPVSELDALASKHTMIYPMASRCGVFAKTDLQNLLSRDIPREDICRFGLPCGGLADPGNPCARIYSQAVDPVLRRTAYIFACVEKGFYGSPATRSR